MEAHFFMAIQLELNIYDKDPIEHLTDVWAINEEKNQKKFRRLFAENTMLKERLKKIEEYIEHQKRQNIDVAQFDEYDLFSYRKGA